MTSLSEFRDLGLETLKTRRDNAREALAQGNKG